MYSLAQRGGLPSGVTARFTQDAKYKTTTQTSGYFQFNLRGPQSLSRYVLDDGRVRLVASNYRTLSLHEETTMGTFKYLHSVNFGFDLGQNVVFESQGRTYVIVERVLNDNTVF